MLGIKNREVESLMRDSTSLFLMPNMNVINDLLDKNKFYLNPLFKNIPYKNQLATG